MIQGIIEVVQLKPGEIKKLNKAFESNANLHEVIGCGRTAVWRARKGDDMSIENLNKIRKFLNQQKVG